MTTPAGQLFECLDALQGTPLVTGGELSARLGVHPRTVRRYIAALQDLGIPVAAERGVGGGYRLQPGYRLPPLMLDGDEATVVVLGLLSARRQGIDTERPAGERALAKIRRVLPERLRRQVEALEATATVAATRPARTGDTTGAADPPAAALLELADATGRGRRVTCRYTRHDGERSVRELSPFGLVAHAGRWYLPAFDHGRGELRTFRVDRLRDVAITSPGVAAPPGFDAAAHVQQSLARVPWRWTVEVTLAAPFALAAARVPQTLATLTPDGPDRTHMRLHVEELDWAARVLAGLDCNLTVHGPPELRPALHALAARLTRAAEAC
ncbi:hypothetical protein DSM112329_00201 [Paraconexibacter sp. AEG42_29]|uniref:Transcriptional regulator n=1 Tax=Paraconexibacter sp. AEG42_29 TaxID=2997339 RepID=A0AAU7ANY6_9ACTN